MKTILPLLLALCFYQLTTQTASALDLLDLDGPDNFWECILDKVPGSSYGVEFRKKVAECRQDFPYNKHLEKSATYFFGLLNNPTASECVSQHIANTPNGKARKAIKEACLHLYP